MDIDHIVLWVDNQQRSLAFFVDLLGMEPVRSDDVGAKLSRRGLVAERAPNQRPVLARRMQAISKKQLLTEHAGPQLAERAKKALRHIGERKRRTPSPPRSAQTLPKKAENGWLPLQRLHPQVLHHAVEGDANPLPHLGVLDRLDRFPDGVHLDGNVGGGGPVPMCDNETSQAIGCRKALIGF